jgi:hypothetical protein
MINKAPEHQNDELKASPVCDQSSASDLGDDLSGPSDNPHQEDPNQPSDSGERLEQFNEKNYDSDEDTLQFPSPPF